jgi:hypothetical protein
MSPAAGAADDLEAGTDVCWSSGDAEVGAGVGVEAGSAAVVVGVGVEVGVWLDVGVGVGVGVVLEVGSAVGHGPMQIFGVGVSVTTGASTVISTTSLSMREPSVAETVTGYVPTW